MAELLQEQTVCYWSCRRRSRKELKNNFSSFLFFFLMLGLKKKMSCSRHSATMRDQTSSRHSQL
jgi:hypothetical protein